jgi:aryl-alcohol dehydrogenase-like predicted oxidoreductase
VHTRQLGTSDLTVSALGLGCMGMSWVYNATERDDAESVRVIHRAIELGITLFDTADLYGPFVNEELVGRALADRRDEVVLATKCGLVPDMELYPETVKVTPNGRPEHVRASCEGSLKRLGVEYVDLYQLHRIDPEVPIEETWGAMAELVQAGKARHLGLSEAGVDALERANAIHPVSTLQSEMSLWSRDPLAEVLPWCQANGVGFMPFSPLGRGFLTGSITSADQLPSSDFRAQMPRFAEGALETNLGIVDVVRRVAERHQATPAQVALAWLLAKGDRVVPIPGATRLDHIEDNARAADLTLDAADIAELDDVPAAVGARF